MVISRIKTTMFSLFLLTAIESRAAINGSAMNAIHANKAQMVSLNLQIKSNNKTVKSDLTMPFYQTAELERKIDNKNVLIEINPRRGKNSEEIALEMRFYRSSGAKAFYKKDIIAKMNQESKISFRGMKVSVRPVIN